MQRNVRAASKNALHIYRFTPTALAASVHCNTHSQRYGTAAFFQLSERASVFHRNDAISCCSTDSIARTIYPARMLQQHSLGLYRVADSCGEIHCNFSKQASAVWNTALERLRKNVQNYKETSDIALSCGVFNGCMNYEFSLPISCY